jgi:hypothetical protein
MIGLAAGTHIWEPRFPLEKADAMVVKRRVPVYQGMWRMLPPEVEKACGWYCATNQLTKTDLLNPEMAGDQPVCVIDLATPISGGISEPMPAIGGNYES